MRQKLLSIAILIAMVLGTTITFSSCSKDNDDDNSKTFEKQSILVGSWKTSWGEDDGYGLLTFKSDGTGTFLDFDYHSGARTDFFYWLYDDASSILTLMWLEDGKVDYKEIAHLKWLNDKTFFADELVEDNRVWVKQ